MRNKALTCLVTVNQEGSVFIRGARSHVHQAQPGAAVKAKVTTSIKTMAREKDNLFKSAAMLVDCAMTQMEERNIADVNPDYMARIANRLHQKNRPAEPKTLDFELAKDYIPEDFLQKDLYMDGACHLIFCQHRAVVPAKESQDMVYGCNFSGGAETI